MLEIIQGRGTGKAKQLLAAARENNAAIITQNKPAFEVKAKSLGFEDIEILDYQDLQNDNYTFGKPMYIHNGDKMLSWLLDYYYNIQVAGFTATSENAQSTKQHEPRQKPQKKTKTKGI